MRFQLDEFLPAAYILDHLTAVGRAEVELTAKQALVVTLSYAIQGGRNPYRVYRDARTSERRARRALVTVTGLFDQLAQRWSDNYRALRYRCPGIRVRNSVKLFYHPSVPAPG